MNILFVDDERSAHTNFCYDVRHLATISKVEYCFDYDSAMAYAKENHIDCAFLDVCLPGKNGITLANDLRAIQPHIEFAFVTGYDEYAREAYKAGGRAYLSKPYETEELMRVLDLMKKLVHPTAQPEENGYEGKHHVFAKTFGTFDLLLDGVAVHFKNAKAKELLAYLIHQMGGSVSNSQIFFNLWEKQEYTRATSTYVRRTIRALKDELEEMDLGDIVIAQRNNIRIDTRKIMCDAYALLNGNRAAARTYNDQYMSQYYWGEETVALLTRTAETLLK